MRIYKYPTEDNQYVGFNDKDEAFVVEKDGTILYSIDSKSNKAIDARISSEKPLFVVEE